MRFTEHSGVLRGAEDGRGGVVLDIDKCRTVQLFNMVQLVQSIHNPTVPATSAKAKECPLW